MKDAKTIAELVEKWRFNPQSHLQFLDSRGLAFENKEWWYLTLSGGLVSVTGSLLDVFSRVAAEWVFVAPLVTLFVSLIAWYVQLNYKREYLANLALKAEFIALCEGKIELNEENNPFNYDKRGESFVCKAGYGKALTHCLGKLSLFTVIILFSLMMTINLLP